MDDTVDETAVLPRPVDTNLTVKTDKKPFSFTPFFVSVAVWIGVAIIVAGAYAAVRRNGLFCDTGNTTWSGGILSGSFGNNPCGNPAGFVAGRAFNYYATEDGVLNYMIVAIPVDGVMTTFIGKNGLFNGSSSVPSCPLNYSGRIFDDGGPCDNRSFGWSTSCSSPDVGTIGKTIGLNTVYLPQVPWNSSIPGMRGSFISGPKGVPPVVTINNISYISECRFPLWSDTDIGIGLSGVGAFVAGQNGGDLIGSVLRTKTEAIGAAQAFCSPEFTNSPEISALINGPESL